MILNLLSKIGFPIPSLLLIGTLSSLLVVSNWQMVSTKKTLTEAEKKIVLLERANITLADTITELNVSLEKMPREYIETTKSVYKNICEGQIRGDEILRLPPLVVSGDENKRSNQDEERTANIDDKLPSDLIRLLE